MKIKIFQVSDDCFIGASSVQEALHYCKVKGIKNVFKKSDVKEASMDSDFFNETLGLISFRDQLIIDLKNKELRVPYVFALIV